MKLEQLEKLKSTCVVKTIDASAPKVITIDCDTHLIVQGEVHLECIECKDNVETLIISGDALYVNQPANDVAIGVRVDRSLSYGRYQLSNSKLRVYVDCMEIHTSSGLRNCGIGVFGVRSISSGDFTDNCKVIDTPYNTVIQLETLQGTTKYSKDPVYYTQLEYGKYKSSVDNALEEKMLWEYANDRLADLYYTVCDCLVHEDLTGYNRNLEELVNLIDTALDISTASNFGFCALKIFSSITKGLYTNNPCAPAVTRIPASIVAYKCLEKELELFRVVTNVPLSLRLWIVYHDATDNLFLERKDPDNMSSLRELGMSPTECKHYNLPAGIDFSKECYRSIWGVPYYKWDGANTLVEHSAVHTGSSWTAKCSLVPNVATTFDLFSRIPDMFAGHTVRVLVVDDKDYNKLTWKDITTCNEGSTDAGANYVLVSTDDFDLFKCN